jgi:hypothetical protein
MQRLPAILMLAIIVLSGCACRSKGARPSDPTNLWNRNEVVAVPDVCREPDGNRAEHPVPLPRVRPPVAVAPRVAQDLQRSGRATALIPMSFAYAGGAFLGTPFILPSLFFADDPDYCWAD